MTEAHHLGAQRGGCQSPGQETGGLLRAQERSHCVRCRLTGRKPVTTQKRNAQADALRAGTRELHAGDQHRPASVWWRMTESGRLVPVPSKPWRATASRGIRSSDSSPPPHLITIARSRRMLTNGHAWAGYTDPTTDVPSYPLRIGPKRESEFSGVGVWDASNKWIATFRNHEDAQRYVEDGKQRAKAMEAARELAYDSSKVDTGDDDRTLCRVCLRYFSSFGIGHHTKVKHGMRLGRMLELRVPTEREFREFHATKARSAP